MDLAAFLDWTVYGNTVRTWLSALALLVGGVTVLLLAKKVIERRSSPFASRTRTEVDDLVIDLLHRTRFLFLLVLALAAATQVLGLSPFGRQLVRQVALVALLVQGALWGNGLVAFWVKRYTTRRATTDAGTLTMISAVGFAARVFVWSVVLLLALDNLGIEVTALVTGLGIGGIAVALAVQNILGDLFGALSIVLDKPFLVGDFIVVDQYMGSVEHVGLKTTRLRSVTGEQIIFSNADLLKSRIRNYKRLAERRVTFTIAVDYDTPPDRLAAVPVWVREIIDAQPHTRFERAHFQSFGPSSLSFETVYVVTTPDYNTYMDVQQAINLAILQRLKAEGVEFAYPARTPLVPKRPAEETVESG